MSLNHMIREIGNGLVGGFLEAVADVLKAEATELGGRREARLMGRQCGDELLDVFAFQHGDLIDSDGNPVARFVYSTHGREPKPSSQYTDSTTRVRTPYGGSS